MAEKLVRFSDLSNQMMLHDDAAVRIEIMTHPALPPGRTCSIEALAEEIKGVEEAALDVAVFTLRRDGEEPATITMDRAAFDKLATDQPMEMLIEASMQHATKPAAGARVDFSTLQNCAKPHRGKTTEAEKKTVAQNFDAVNERLEADGMRTLDLTNATLVERYGLHAVAKERGIDPR